MTIQLSDNYPKIIRDFFRFDDSVSDGSAHTPVDLPFAYDASKLQAEAEALPYDDRRVARCYVFGPERESDTGCDLTVSRDQRFERKISLTDFPEIDRFIGNCPGLTYMTFKKMRPKDYIMPHIDSECNPYKIYVPLSWPAGNVFKVYDQGEVDFTGNRPNIIATSGHMHAVVNDSDQPRIIFSFYLDWSHPTWDRLLKDSSIS